MAVSLLWGSSYFFIKLAVATIPPFSVVAIRCGLAVAILLPIIIFMKLPMPKTRNQWRGLALQAFLNNFGAWIILIWAQQYIDSSEAGVLNSTVPIFVFLITFFITKHESTNFTKFFGALLGLTGIIIVIGFDKLGNLGNNLWAELAVILCSIMYAFANIQTRKFHDLSPIVLSFATLSISFACTLPLSLIFDKPWQLAISQQSLYAAAFLGVFCTALAFVLFVYLNRLIGSIRSASQSYIRSVISVFLGVFILGEVLEFRTIIGIIITIIGVVIINTPSLKFPKYFPIK